MITERTWYILGNGIELGDEEFTILPYLKIQKVHQLSIFDLAKLGANGFSQWSLIQPFCYAKNNFEIISSENHKSYGYDILNRAWLLNTLLVLRRKVRINSIALLNYSWNDLGVINKHHKINANLCDYHVKMLNPFSLNENKINTNDIKWLQDYFEITNDLAFYHDKFRYSLDAINSWRYCVDFKSAIAILWSAIESIVDVSQEITFRLSLSISSLLCERGENRMQKFEDIKNLYNLRSKVIHGSGINDIDIKKALVGSFNLLSELIVYMIENNKMVNRMDFNSAIFK